jgi:hypothetical protein
VTPESKQRCRGDNQSSVRCHRSCTNDVGLFEVLSESKPWTVRQVADAFSASFTTISSALIGSRIKDWLSACAALKIDASFRLNSLPKEANLLQS